MLRFARTAHVKPEGAAAKLKAAKRAPFTGNNIIY